jgi:type VI secretion system secreted protein VgrG
MQRQEGRATCLHGVGGVRAQAVGEWNRIDGNAVLDALQPEDREYITVQLSTWCENNFPKELKDRVQNLLATSESGIRGWIARSSDLTSPSPDTSQRHVNKFVAVRRDVPILPTWDPQVDLPRMNVMTATVVGAANTPVWCDELGRVKVSIHGLDPADHVHASGAGTNGDDGDSAWVRVNFLWCGDGFGVIFPLRPGMEVILGFEHGDPSRPMIIGTRYNATHMPPRFDHLDGLPNNAALSGIVTRELNGERQQQLRFNDTPGSISVQLGTDHAATQVNIGALSTPMDQGQTQPRGEGVEIRTDKAGAFRTAEAMLLSTWKRLQARGPAMDASEHLGLMKDFADLFKSLGDYAAQHQGLATDSQPTTQLQTDVQAGTEPVMSLTAPAGVATTTSKTIMSYAGVNIDSVAMQHLQYTAGGYHVVNAGKGASLFAHEGGITSIAHHGKLLMQSQHDDTQIDSAKDIKLSAIGGKFVAMADKEIVLMLSSGTYLRLFDGGIEMGSQKPLTVKTDGHNWGGPGTMSADMPTFSDGDLGRTPRLLSPTSGQPVAGMQLHVQRDEGNLAGQTDAAGQGPKIKASGLQRLKSFFLDQRS